MIAVEERDFSEPRKCANCGCEWGELLPMVADDDDDALVYCQECRIDFQVDNWEYFV